jgi:3-isopropylmalate dehydrogenase
MSNRILVLAGDGVGPEITRQAMRVLGALRERHGLEIELDEALMGGIAVDQCGNSLPEETLDKAHAADAVLLGAVGGPRWDGLARDKRPETGLLRLRSELGLFANLRPAFLYPQLVDASSLRPEVVAGLDVMIVRELTGGLYFGQPRQIKQDRQGRRAAVNTMAYDEDEIARVARVGFNVALERGGRLCSVDKANVLECSELWRGVVGEIAEDFPRVKLSHMYVDNAAMQLVRAPDQFDVIVTGNLFGDILSDAAAMLTGSIGMLSSASLDTRSKGVYEPVHGSAPDIAGRDAANPLATILSVSMMLKYSLQRADLAEKVDAAVAAVLARGQRTRDIARDGEQAVSTSEMGAAIVHELS